MIKASGRKGSGGTPRVCEERAEPLHCCLFPLSLHHNMAATAAYRLKTVPFENLADLLS
jgi:hypothetical protein